jgi:broad specificity phosphatase PhoE
VPARLLLVSHAATAANESEDIVQGWRQNPLNAHGRQETAELAGWLKGLDGQLLLTSDLTRAKQTAAIIGKEIGLTPLPSRAWRPWNTGKFSGQPSGKARPLIDGFVKMPGRAIPEGESLNSFKERLLPALTRLLAQVRQREATVVLVTHSRDVSLIQDWLDAGGNAEQMQLRHLRADTVKPGAVFEITPRGSFWKGRWLDKGD